MRSLLPILILSLASVCTFPTQTSARDLHSPQNKRGSLHPHPHDKFVRSNHFNKERDSTNGSGPGSDAELLVARPDGGQTSSQTASSVPSPTISVSVPMDDRVVPLPVLTAAPELEKRACAAKYTGSKTTIKGTGTLPKPTSFVKRNGVGLQLDGKAFRILGPNIYWLGLDENVVPNPSYPDKARVREAMAIAVAMGSTTIRALTLGVSTGNSLSVEPSLNNFNAKAFDAIDYALFAAREYGLRVIITLTDDYDYYHGGKYDFLRFNSVDTGNFGNAFYTNRPVIDSYKNYIKNFISHKNAYTGVRYYNDPTIIAWETGNELGAYIGREGYPPAAWTQEIAKWIKSYAPNQLVIDGTDGFWNYTTKVSAPGLQVAEIDIASDHLYPLNSGLLTKDISLVNQYKKNLLIGEFDWTGLNGGTSLSDFLTTLSNTAYMGALPWSVFGHDSQCCAYVTHNDGYSIYYPNGNSASQQGNILSIVKAFYKLTGRAVPSSLPAVACPQPVF